METTRNPVRPPEHHFYLREPVEHRTFYRDGGIWITDRWVTVQGRRFPVEHLTNLRTAREPMQSATAASTVMAFLAVVAVATFMVFAGEPGIRLGSPLLVTVPIGVAIIAWRLRRRLFALYADYGDQTVQVFSVPDQWRYKQICRSLMRAREYSLEHDF
jgi:fatty acid desaturase